MVLKRYDKFLRLFETLKLKLANQPFTPKSPSCTKLVLSCFIVAPTSHEFKPLEIKLILPLVVLGLRDVII